MSDIRIVVVLTDANPELISEFENITPRARAERMRVLATLGQRLGSYSGQPRIRSPAPAIPAQPLASSSPPAVANPAVVEPVASSVHSAVQPIAEEPTTKGVIDVPPGVPTVTSKPRIGSNVARFAASLGSDNSK